MAVVAEHAEGGDVEHQAGGDLHVGADPRGRDGAEDVAVRKGEHAASWLAGEDDELLGARIDLRGSFPLGRSVGVDLPAGVELM